MVVGCPLSRTRFRHYSLLLQLQSMYIKLHHILTIPKTMRRFRDFSSDTNGKYDSPPTKDVLTSAYPIRFFCSFIVWYVDYALQVIPFPALGHDHCANYNLIDSTCWDRLINEVSKFHWHFFFATFPDQHFYTCDWRRNMKSKVDVDELPAININIFHDSKCLKRKMRLRLVYISSFAVGFSSEVDITFWLPVHILDRLHGICLSSLFSFFPVFYFYHPFGQFIVV